MHELNIATMLSRGRLKDRATRKTEAAQLLLEDPRATSLLAEIWEIEERIHQKCSHPQYADSHGGLAHGSGTLWGFRLLEGHLNSILNPTQNAETGSSATDR